MKNILAFTLFLCSIAVGQKNPDWIIYTTSNSQLKSCNIYDIEVDKFNNKWILSDSGLTKIPFDNSTWAHYTTFPPYNLNFRQAKFMTVDNDGDLWLGGWLGNSLGVVEFNGVTLRQFRTNNSGLPNEVIHGLTVDKYNNVYALCGLPGPSYELYLAKFDGSTWQSYPGYFFYDDAGDIAPADSQGSIWIAGPTGLWKFSGSSYTQVMSGSFGGYLAEMLFDNSGNLWSAHGLGGWGSLRKIKDGNITHYQTIKAISLESIDNTLWVGTEDPESSGSLIKYKNDNFTYYTVQNSLLPENNYVNKLKADKLGNLWISTLKYLSTTITGALVIYKEGGVVFTPVELNSFTAVLLGDVVNLNWQTATELNNRGFEVERSFNGSAYSTIGFIAGNGTTTKPCSYSYTDDLSDKNISGTVLYRLKQLDNDGTFEYSDVVSVVKNEIPSAFVLEQNYPNPFNPSTVIKYQLPTEGNVTLKVYNNLGEEIALLVNEFKQAGIYTADFSAANLPSGIYYYRLTGDNGFSATKKMMVVK